MPTEANKFATAVELREMLDRVIEKNPVALVMFSMDNGGGHLVLDSISDELNTIGDAHFSLRQYDTGNRVDVLKVEDHTPLFS